MAHRIAFGGAPTWKWTNLGDAQVLKLADSTQTNVRNGEKPLPGILKPFATWAKSLLDTVAGTELFEVATA